ncbi:ADP-forming succinate--CoA ligase subunit beta [Aciduricibacillus chroicocephali]|uniref:Succinate--CoA ligase [ADP-forming] subunit beta n=1 Tax=Aciduricibacillus chroicocephali TaxID=3054939 RepID=A0ABY9L1K0_9BACI|nr:ADP-forming succinate--CoA ligase subunit beta [Bacillaceae bacterium 44XB]
MNIHEYQAKEILKSKGIPVPIGFPAMTKEEADNAIDGMDAQVIVVKAQIHAGGRGKAGGVKICHTKEDAKAAAAELLDRELITKQTGPVGKVVRRLLIEEGCEIEREFYLSVAMDRSQSKIVLIGSAAGGMNIEEIAKKEPEKICRETVDPAFGLSDFQARRLAFAMGLPAALARSGASFITKLYKLFVDHDCTIAEINPLIVTKGNELVALDAKLSFDDNALYRHPELNELKDETEENQREKEAAEHELSYIALDGNIGCMVNGAGLAMATMDIIRHHGGTPANFLDVGGDATVEKVTEAFKIILKDRNVKGIFVNIFGGIMKCDIIASGIVEAARATNLQLPLVVRLEGTNSVEGKRILSESDLTIIPADSLGGGAGKIVSLVR